MQMRLKMDSSDSSHNRSPFADWEGRGADSCPAWQRRPSQWIIERLARKMFDIQKGAMCKAKTFAAGGYNMLYSINTDEEDDPKHLFRVSMPLIHGHKTKSEISTLMFLERSTSLPVPEVVAWNPSRRNQLKLEWMIMTRLEGRTLTDEWWSIGTEGLMQLTDELARYHAELWKWENQFSAMGSLYENEPNATYHGRAFPALSNNENLSVGPIVSTNVIADGRYPYAKLIGPYKSTRVYMQERLDFERAMIVKLYQENRRSQRFFESAIATIDELQSNLLMLVEPEEDNIASTVLWHHDLHSSNLLVDEDGSITGIVDWEMTAFVPLWKAQGFPRLFLSRARTVVPRIEDYGGAVDEDDTIYWDAAEFPVHETEPDNLDPSDADQHKELQRGRFWRHYKEWQKTEMRKRYRRVMENQCPRWADRRTQRTRVRELDLAISWRVDEPMVHGHIEKWVADIRAGCVSSLWERLYPACP